MKRFALTTLLVLLLLALVACGGPDDARQPQDPAPSGDTQPAQPEGDDPADAKGEEDVTAPVEADSKTERLMLSLDEDKGVHVEAVMLMEDGNEIMRMSMMSKGTLSYAEMDMGGFQQIVISNADGYFLCDPADKTAMKMSAEELENAGVSASTADELQRIASMPDHSIETVELFGKTYDAEVFADEGTEAKFCYDGESLVYIVATTAGISVIMQIDAFDDQVDESKFAVPADYTVSEM